MVFVNDKLIGSWNQVSTNGSLASFNRELGELSVGDTIWVMVDPLESNAYDAFVGFDFSIQRLAPVETHAGGAALSVPEPSTIALLLLALVGCPIRRRSTTALQ